jgi:sugar O-acyltransferase (sialic acid O-acetyltransferase NeuD family)
MRRIAILGAGDLGLSLKTYLEDRGDARLAGFLDDGRARGTEAHGLEVLGGSGDAPALSKAGAFDEVVYAIGYRDFAARARLFDELRAKGVRFAGVHHPTAMVHRTAQLAEGVHLFPGVLVDMAVKIDRNVVVNTGTILAHHAEVGAHGYFGPGARVAGFTKVGEACFVGIGASLVEKIEIGERCVVAAGAVVRESAPAGVLLAGVPAVVKRTSGKPGGA